MTILLGVFILSLILSAFLSICEMAFVSSNQLKIRERADNGDENAKKILKLYSRSQEFLSSILIGNNIANITATAVAAYFFEHYLGLHNEWIVTLVMAPLLIILCELVPKDFGRIRSESFLLKWPALLLFFMKVLEGPVRFMMYWVEALLGRFKHILHKNIFVSENEFRMLIEESAKFGVLDRHEKQLINTILDFERIHLNTVMIPLERVAKVDITSSTVGDIKALAKKMHARMILVYEEIPSIVVGMVYVFDLLFEENDAKGLKEYLRSPIFLGERTSIEKAFLTLQQKRQSYAVVLDSNSEAVGVVPIERLIDFEHITPLS